MFPNHPTNPVPSDPLLLMREAKAALTKATEALFLAKLASKYHEDALASAIDALCQLEKVN